MWFEKYYTPSKYLYDQYIPSTSKKLITNIEFLNYLPSMMQKFRKLWLDLLYSHVISFQYIVSGLIYSYIVIFSFIFNFSKAGIAPCPGDKSVVPYLSTKDYEYFGWFLLIRMTWSSNTALKLVNIGKPQWASFRMAKNKYIIVSSW